MRLLIAAALLSVGFANLPAMAAPQEKVHGCTFDTISEEDRSRFQSRYKRRLRLHGAEVADTWLHEQACMTAEERRAARPEKPVLDKDGNPCTKTRLEMRVSPGFDGAMTMSPVPVCDD